MTITLQSAEAILSGARAAGRDHGMSPLTVVVLDSGGNVIAVQREDGASNKRFEIAHGKAFGAVSLGVDSRDLMTRAEKQPYFIAAVTSAIGGSLIPVPGGVIIRDEAGKVLGAVGVSGDSSNNDEAAAFAGIRAAGFVLTER